MAARRKNARMQGNPALREQESKDPMIQSEVVDERISVSSGAEIKNAKMGKWGWAGIIFAALCVYWWKTSNWPVVAVVGMKPVWRYAVNQELYKQGGKSVVDAMVTEKLVEQELEKAGVRVTDGQVEEKLAEIKKNFEKEEDFNAALTERRITLADLKKQIKLQVGIEKLLADRVEVTASDTATLIKEMGSLLTATTAAEKEKEAAELIRNQKLQMEINNWIEKIRSNGKVWWIGKV